jgi:hypothetical protein
MGLSKEKENGCIKKNTPAKEYGITKSKWTLTKLLNYRCIKYKLINKGAPFVYYRNFLI